jgi:hypothetical protein
MAWVMSIFSFKADLNTRYRKQLSGLVGYQVITSSKVVFVNDQVMIFHFVIREITK